jgi:prepilin-type N-terminal cleavage/methylation domain-containing protein
MIVLPEALGRGKSEGGFTLLELIIVLAIVSITMGVGLVGYRTIQENTAARRAAEVFAMDLTLARSSAVRERRPVAIVFDEANLRYVIRTGAGRVIRVRDFSPEGEIRLGAISVELTGDSVAFNARGISDLDGAGGSLGRARFEAGGGRYEVEFNALGNSRVEPF